MHVQSLKWMLNGLPVCQNLLVDIKDPMVSFVKIRHVIAGTLSKFQIPARTSREHHISSTAIPSANDATSSLVLHMNKEGDSKSFQ